MERPQGERRAALEQLLDEVTPPVYLTPMTRDRRSAEWLQRFEGAGLDGVIAKPDAGVSAGQAGDVEDQARAHRRLCGRRLSLAQEGARIIGSLLLGLFDDQGRLHHVGVTSSFTMDRRKELVEEFAPLRKDAMASHPWREWVEAMSATTPEAMAHWATHARRPQPVERGQGPVVGAVTNRTGLRGEVRPHAG